MSTVRPEELRSAAASIELLAKRRMELAAAEHEWRTRLFEAADAIELLQAELSTEKRWRTEAEKTMSSSMLARIVAAAHAAAPSDCQAAIDATAPESTTPSRHPTREEVAEAILAVVGSPEFREELRGEVRFALGLPAQGEKP